MALFRQRGILKKCVDLFRLFGCYLGKARGNAVYRVEFSKEAANFLEKQDKKTAARIFARIKKLAEDPYAPNNNVRKLQGRDGYRLRIGDVRVIYEIYDDILLVDVLDIGYRGGIY